MSLNIRSSEKVRGVRICFCLSSVEKGKEKKTMSFFFVYGKMSKCQPLFSSSCVFFFCVCGKMSKCQALPLSCVYETGGMSNWQSVKVLVMTKQTLCKMVVSIPTFEKVQWTHICFGQLWSVEKRKKKQLLFFGFSVYGKMSKCQLLFLVLWIFFCVLWIFFLVCVTIWKCPHHVLWNIRVLTTEESQDGIQSSCVTTRACFFLSSTVKMSNCHLFLVNTIYNSGTIFCLRFYVLEKCSRSFVIKNWINHHCIPKFGSQSVDSFETAWLFNWTEGFLPDSSKWSNLMRST